LLLLVEMRQYSPYRRDYTDKTVNGGDNVGAPSANFLFDRAAKGEGT